MIRFSEEKVLFLHQLIIAETGGSAELRDIRLLDSALEGCFQTFGGKKCPMEMQAKLSIYAHLAQAVDDVKSERVQELDAACGDILNELKELEL